MARLMLPAVARRRLRRSDRQRGMMLSVLEAIAVGGYFAAIEIGLVRMLVEFPAAHPSAVILHATITLIGMTLVGPFSTKAISWLGGNRRTVLVLSTIQGVSLLAMAVPLAFKDHAWAFPTAFILGIVTGMVGNLGGAAWVAWMGGMIPPSVRGRYLTGRMRLFLFSNLAFCGLFMGLDWAFAPLGEHRAMAVLGVIAVVGALSRLTSTWIMSHQPDLHRATGSGYRSAPLAAAGDRGFLTFLRTLATNEFGRWCVVWSLFMFAGNLAASCFAQFLGRPASGGGLVTDDGKVLSIVWFIVLMKVATVSRLMVLPFCGLLVDRYGPGSVLRLSAFGIALVPAMWAFYPTVPTLILSELMSGVVWCMAETALGVQMFSCHKDPVERSRLIGHFQTCAGIAQIAATALSAWLILWVPPFDGSAFRTIFLISFALRIPVLILALAWLPRGAFALHDERIGLWRLIPGADTAVGVARSLMRYVGKAEG